MSVIVEQSIFYIQPQRKAEMSGTYGDEHNALFLTISATIGFTHDRAGQCAAQSCSASRQRSPPLFHRPHPHTKAHEMNALNYFKAGRGLLLHQSGDGFSFAYNVETIETGDPTMLAKKASETYPLRYAAFDEPGTLFVRPEGAERFAGCEMAVVLIKDGKGADRIHGELYSHQMSHFVAQIQTRDSGSWTTIWKEASADLGALTLKFEEKLRDADPRP